MAPYRGTYRIMTCLAIHSPIGHLTCSMCGCNWSLEKVWEKVQLLLYLNVSTDVHVHCMQHIFIGSGIICELQEVMISVKATQLWHFGSVWDKNLSNVIEAEEKSPSFHGYLRYTLTCGIIAFSTRSTILSAYYHLPSTICNWVGLFEHVMYTKRVHGAMKLYLGCN